MTRIFDIVSEENICLKCFALGKEEGKRLRTNDYMIVNNLNQELFAKGWTAMDELVLIEGLNKFGNWESISKKLQETGRKKTKEQCELHYMNVKRVYEQYWWRIGDGLEEMGNILAAETNDNPLRSLKEFVNNQDLSKEPNKTLIDQKLDRYREKIEANCNQEFHKLKEYTDQIGYYPLRRDFEVEYNPDAERYLADMEFEEEDTLEEVEIKRKILDCYNKQLDQRIRRKNFVVDHLLSISSFEQMEKSTTEEKLVREKMKPFERMHSPEEHQKLIKLIMKGRSLKRRIQELDDYQQRKINSFEQVEVCTINQETNIEGERGVIAQAVYRP